MYFFDLYGYPRCVILQGIFLSKNRMDDRIQYFFDAIFAENLQSLICPNTIGLEQKRACLFVYFLLFQFCFLLGSILFENLFTFFFPQAGRSSHFFSFLNALDGRSPAKSFQSFSFPLRLTIHLAICLCFAWPLHLLQVVAFFPLALKKKKK